MSSPNKTEITISNRTILRIVVLVIVALAGLRAFISLSHAITLILIAAFLAMALNPAVSFISTHILSKRQRTTSTAIAFFSLIISLITFFSIVIPPLFNQVAIFVEKVPSTIQNLKTQDSTVGRFVQKNGLDKQIDNFSRDFKSKLGVRPVFDTATRIGGSIVSLLAVLAMTFMMLNEGPKWFENAMILIPKEKREHRKKLIVKMYSMVTGYVNGQLITASIAAFFMFLMLLITSSILHISINAVALAGIMAIFGLIPMIGNPIGAGIIVLACLLSSVNLAIIMLIYIVIYFQIENLTLQPYIQSKQNELTPLTVFVSALIGVSYGGFVGALFAIPVIGCIRILLIDYIQTKKLT